ncbi:MAG: hypothetical protein EXQ81_04190 [Thermoleophilia bacterium]|nr:hypothetical protein [Thermoleophilia bacterium]
MPRLYGDRISDAESAELIAKLRARGTPDAAIGADTVGKGPGRDATVATTLQAREAILRELRDWANLDSEAPNLAVIRDHLAGQQQGQRII